MKRLVIIKIKIERPEECPPFYKKTDFNFKFRDKPRNTNGFLTKQIFLRGGGNIVLSDPEPYLPSLDFTFNFENKSYKKITTRSNINGSRTFNIKREYIFPKLRIIVNKITIKHKLYNFYNIPKNFGQSPLRAIKVSSAEKVESVSLMFMTLNKKNTEYHINIEHITHYNTFTVFYRLSRITQGLLIDL